MQVNPRTIRKEIIFLARLKVAASFLSNIHSMLRWLIDEDEFILVIEVESSLRMATKNKGTINRQPISKVRDDPPLGSGRIRQGWV